MENLTNILSLCASNDRRAQKILYERFYPLMIKTSMRYTQDMLTAKATVNLSFLKALKSIDQTKAETFAGWLKKIVINQAIDQLRKEKTYKDTVVLEQTHKRTNADQNTAIQSLVTKDLLLLIERLSSPSKEVFKLNILDGYKHKEIAKILSIGESKSKWHLAKARRELKESYIKIYGK